MILETIDNFEWTVNCLVNQYKTCAAYNVIYLLY